MANEEHVALLKQDVDAWNRWRSENPGIHPDLRAADLQGANLSADLRGADLSGADLSGANLSKTKFSKANLNEANLSGGNLRRVNLSWARLYKANLREADLTGARLFQAFLPEADLTGAFLSGADLSEANLLMAFLDAANLRNAVLSSANLHGAGLTEADLTGAFLDAADLTTARLFRASLSSAYLHGADLTEADLTEADLTEADLTEADLTEVSLVRADLTGADLTGCRVYGISTWELKLSEDTKQENLVITHDFEPDVTVDDIEIAQFVYLLLNNQKIRNVIDTITAKAVLILGRFTPERKEVLDAVREELRRHDYLPILFDFDVPANRDITETVSLLARMARFIVADLTDPSSIPKELEAIVPHLAIPVQPLIEGSDRPFAMFKDYWKYEWVLPVYRYEALEPLCKALEEKVINPAEAKVKALEERRRLIEAELTKPQ
jgi:uncharacterized protein YjbI with pentapeptide repeats